MKILTILYDGGEAAREEPRLLGTTENRLGIEQWLKEQGHEFIVSSDKEGPNSVFEREIVDKAKNLKLCVTAGVGSDHIDLNAANEKNITVAEVSGSNVVSVAEHVVMSILLLVRNYTPAHEMIERGDWQVSQIARNAFDLEGKVVGTIGAGRIGYRVLERLKPFDCKELLYFDYAPLPKGMRCPSTHLFEAAERIGAVRVDKLEDLLARCDVVTVNCPLHEGTRNLINKDNIKLMKKGSWLVNTARGAICNAEAVKEALESGHLNGYAGDVWNVQPAPRDHPWRTMKNPLGAGNGMVPHYSGTTLDAQYRYATGTKSILQNFFEGKEQDIANVIVTGGQYATKAYGQRIAAKV
ncbi:NAD-dependent formate dehydrogenase [Auricularia subglabra TFB-10046 SS5]|nr:NAD-dependent formate dehydrogenase [Auricularia subglabra TFB-10046 SS5]